jgi:hypothetical protein
MFPPLVHPLRAGALALAVCLSHLAAMRAEAAAPTATNDTCVNAHIVPASGPFPYLSPVVDVLNMATNGDPYLPPACAVGMTRSVWFKFTPAATALYSLSLGPDTGTDFGDGPFGNDSVLAIYTSPSGCAGPFTLINCNDDAQGYNFALAAGLSTNFTAGTTYYILAWVGASTAAGNPAGPIKLQLRVTKPVAPANDLCGSAEVIPNAGAGPFLSSTNDNTLATDTGDQATSCTPGQRSVWFKFAPAVSGTHVISSRDGATTVGNGTLALFQSAGTDCSSLTALTCSSFSESGRGVITRSLTAGTTYYILFWDDELDYLVGETSVQIKITRAGPPFVATLPASSITTTGATFQGTVNPNGGLSTRTRYWFEWGTSTSYTFASPARLVYSSAIPATTNINVSLGTNLTAGLTWYYRAVATNEYGTNFGAAQIIVPAASPVLAPPLLLGGGAARLDFSGQPGRVHYVQASTNLPGNWADLGTATEKAAGIFQYQTTTNAAPYRFFKLRLP